MKGLIYRQLYLSKKSLIIGCSLIGAVFVLEILIFLSFRVGNLSKLDDLDGTIETVATLFISLGSVIVTGTLCSDHDVIQSDFDSKWNVFSYTLPVSDHTYAALLTGTTLVGLIIGIVSGSLNALVVTAISGISIEPLFFLYVIAVGVVFAAMQLLRVPLLLHFRKNSTATAISMVVVMGLMMGATTLFQSWLQNYISTASDENGDDTEALKALAVELKTKLSEFAWVIPIIIVVAFIASYYFSLRELRRREN